MKSILQRIILHLELQAYRFFASPPGKAFLNFLSFGINVKHLPQHSIKKGVQKKDFLIAVTVDTESGYVGKNERRVWQAENPNAFIGYTQGIQNLLDVLGKYGVKATFFLSTQCFSSKGTEYKKINQKLKYLITGNHEIGLHLHPDSDFALQKKLNKKFQYTSAVFYDYNTKLQTIKAAKALVKENLGQDAYKNLISFRWGNWALDSEGAKALNELGFRIDSSATPGIKGHQNDGMRYDWSRVAKHYPWALSIENYQDTEQKNSNITEIPIATFDFFGAVLRADPVDSFLLNKAFDKYYRSADRSEKPFVFVVITHSPEATYSDGSKTRALRDLEKFIQYTKTKKFKDVKFVTLREAYNLIK